MSSLINIGFSGLNSSQIALNVVGQNIANANTIGYSRQEAQFGSLSGFGRLDNGLGVEVTGVRRISDSYLLNQQWRATSSLGYSNSYHQYINTTEQVFGSESMGLTGGLDGFFAALNAAVDSPETSAPRDQVISSANALANRFHMLDSNLVTQERQLEDHLDSSINQANSYIQQVADLNAQIREVSARGGNTSELEDRRDEAVRELSSLMEVRVTTQPNGDYDLSLPQGQPLVLGSSCSELKRNGDELSLTFGTQTMGVSSFGQGSIGGLIDYRDEVLRPLRDELGEIAAKFADDFNAKQEGGIDLNGNPGKPMFVYDPTNPAGSLRIADGFTGSDLAFASSDGGPGDNRNLQEMLTIKDSQYDAYTNLLGRLAIRSSQAKSELNANAKLEWLASDQVSSVSGVNVDEEGIKLMTYTKAYQANAKVISTADQLLSTVLGMF